LTADAGTPVANLAASTGPGTARQLAHEVGEGIGLSPQRLADLRLGKINQPRRHSVSEIVWVRALLILRGAVAATS
jgi:hypothetical protein